RVVGLEQSTISPAVFITDVAESRRNGVPKKVVADLIGTLKAEQRYLHRVSGRQFLIQTVVQMIDARWCPVPPRKTVQLGNGNRRFSALKNGRRFRLDVWRRQYPGLERTVRWIRRSQISVADDEPVHRRHRIRQREIDDASADAGRAQDRPERPRPERRRILRFFVQHAESQQTGRKTVDRQQLNGGVAQAVWHP